MTFTSPRRGISAAIAALVSALLIMPSGTAFADEHRTPHPTEIETHTTLPPEPAIEEEPEQDDAFETPESTEIPEPPVDTSQPIAPKGVEQSRAAATADGAAEKPMPQASRNALANAGAPLTCQPGYVYSIGQGGEIYEINSDSTRKEIEDFGSLNRGNEFNGIGIGPDGTSVYAYYRNTTTRATIYRWKGPGSSPETIQTYNHGLNGSLVAGAVDLRTGNYYFGGYETFAASREWVPRWFGIGGYWRDITEYRFRVWRYVESSKSVDYVGYVNTGIEIGDISRANGDMAFNARGDLFFLVSGGTQAAIGAVRAEELSGTLGRKLQASSTEVKTLSGRNDVNANGIAFDADGSIYLGTANYLYKYDPTTWRQIGSGRNVLRNSTDLAGCSSPSSIGITKNVVDRNHEDDQFTLWLKRDDDKVAHATTEGSATGLQDEQLGPVVALRGETYTISEVMAEGSTSELSTDYQTNWVCTDEEGWQDSGEGTEFDVTVTKLGQTISCEFINTPVPDTQLTLRKAFDTNYGAPENTDDWTLTATPNGGKAIVFDHGDLQQVEAGKYTLSESFGPDGLDAAEVGYELQEIVCSVDDGPDQVVDGELTIKSDTATDCTLINTDLPGAVVWEKTNTNDTPLADSEWLLSGPDDFGELTVVDNGKYDVIETAGTIRVEGLHWGDYTLKETKAPAGFELASHDAKFTITGTEREYTFDDAFINEPLQPGTLPLTGIFSGTWSLIGAAGLALAVLTGLAGTLRRRNTN